MIPLKRRKPTGSGIRRAPERSFPSHLAWCRGFECAIAGKNGHVCSERIEAAHIRVGGNAGTGLKPADTRVIPLCSEAHKLQHSLGEKSFDRRFGIRSGELADELARISPHRHRWMEEGR